MGAEVEQSSGAIELDNSKVTDDFKDNEVPDDALKKMAKYRPSVHLYQEDTVSLHVL